MNDLDGRGSYWFYYDREVWKEFNESGLNNRTATKEVENEAGKYLVFQNLQNLLIKILKS